MQGDQQTNKGDVKPAVNEDAMLEEKIDDEKDQELAIAAEKQSMGT
jgi:hypothetical protein